MYVGNRYNRNPRHLQSVMKRVFELGTSQINVPGSTVTVIPLFEALDGSNIGIHTFLHTYVQLLVTFATIHSYSSVLIASHSPQPLKLVFYLNAR